MNNYLRLICAAALFAVCLSGPSFASEDLEDIMWNLATTTQELSNVEAFIENFPESEHIGEARALAEDIRMSNRAQVLEASIFASLGAVTYDSPLAFGDEHIVGRTLPEIMESSPLYPPVEGLPAEYWQEETCASCHQWTREALCTQSQTYVAKQPDKYRNKEHPFGGLLKINLRNWAQNGCG